MSSLVPGLAGLEGLTMRDQIWTGERRVLNACVRWFPMTETCITQSAWTYVAFFRVDQIVESIVSTISASAGAIIVALTFQGTQEYYAPRICTVTLIIIKYWGGARDYLRCITKTEAYHIGQPRFTRTCTYGAGPVALDTPQRLTLILPRSAWKMETDDGLRRRCSRRRVLALWNFTTKRSVVFTCDRTDIHMLVVG